MRKLSLNKRPLEGVDPRRWGPTKTETQFSGWDRMCICLYKGGLKKLISWKVDDIIFDDILNNSDPSPATPMEEVCGSQGRICWKINLIWPYYMIVSWSVYELLSRITNVFRQTPNLPNSTSMKWLKVSFKAEFNKFEFGVFLLLDRLPYQGSRDYIAGSVTYWPLSAGSGDFVNRMCSYVSK